MDPILLAILGIAAMFLLILLHVPLGVAMGLSGIVGFAILGGLMPALSLLASETASTFSSLDLATIPLFILMGGFASAAGLLRRIFIASLTRWSAIGAGGSRLPLSVVAQASAQCVDRSIATTATFGRVALPSMLARGYSPGFSAGTVAAGGTLGILVPPSVDHGHLRRAGPRTHHHTLCRSYCALHNRRDASRRCDPDFRTPQARRRRRLGRACRGQSGSRFCGKAGRSWC